MEKGLALKMKKDISKKSNPAKLFSCLLNSITQTHIFHLQTTKYSEHMALGSYYESVGDLADSLIEAYQGKYGIVKGYTSEPLTNIKDCVGYFEELHKEVDDARSLFTDTDLLNTLDEVKSLIKSTLYKLKYLS